MAKQDIYQAVTDRIIEALDRGTVPWRNPIAGGGLSFPHNLATGKAYRGINVLLLCCTSLDQGYRSNYWLTFKQAKDQGGQVRKGEKSTPIVFFKKLDIEDKDTGEQKKIPMLRKYNVFNVEQVDGIEPPDLKGRDPDAEEVEALPSTGDIFNGYRGEPALETSGGGGRACYSPLRDTVTMPMASGFENAAAHASVLFHELIHSTGHSKRLDRGLDTNLAPFGSPDYSKEELIAECGAAFLCATTGILPQTIDQSAAYIDGWRRKLKGDKRLVVMAAAAAQRAVDHILGVTWPPEAPDAPQSTPANDDLPGAGAGVDVSDDDLDRVIEQATPIRRQDADARFLNRKLKLALRVMPPPPLCGEGLQQGDLDQLRSYAAKMERWYADHLDTWLEHGVLEADGRSEWLPPMHPVYSGSELADDLQAFPLPGIANLNSTATRDERSAYISAALKWWNDRRLRWIEEGVLDHHENPEVPPEITDPVEPEHPGAMATPPGMERGLWSETAEAGGFTSGGPS